MRAHDLAALNDMILSRARAVVPLCAVHRGVTSADVIGLRHDVDDSARSLDTALKIAQWERERGYRSTFFMLHTASYWHRRDFPTIVGKIEQLGHEIGVHANTIPAALQTGRDPSEILHAALAELRSYAQCVVGVAPHGDPLCYDADGRIRFVNDEIFSDCARPEMGEPDREIVQGNASIRLKPEPLAAFGLEYESYRLPHGRYLSDSGGRWNVPLSDAASGEGQLHILQHPDWWASAFRFTWRR